MFSREKKTGLFLPREGKGKEPGNEDGKMGQPTDTDTPD
jgi:hypothetical protein